MDSFDYSALASMTWDRETVNLIGTIHEYKGRLKTLPPSRSGDLQKMDGLATAQGTKAIVTICGFDVTGTRLSSLIRGDTAPRDKDESETLGYLTALRLIHEDYTGLLIHPSFLLQLHKELFPRCQHAHVDKITNDPLHPEDAVGSDTRLALYSLCDEYEKAARQYRVDPLLVIPRFIRDFLALSPFACGNERMAVLLATLLLLQNGYAAARYISLEEYVVLADIHTDTLLALDDRSVTNLLLKGILYANKSFDERINAAGEDTTSRELVINAIEQKEGFFTKSDLLVYCPTLCRATVENILKELCHDGKIVKCGGGRSTYYMHKII